MHTFLKLKSLDDVTEMLRADGPACLLVAGGTDVLVRPQLLAKCRILIDIGQVAELGGIGLDPDGQLRVGAAATHQEIADHPLVSRRAHLLGMSCASVGSLQIRNRGTLGGNLGNASPAGDSLPALTCLGADLELASCDRVRRVPVDRFFKGPGETLLAIDEVIVSARIPVRSGRTVAFFRKAGQRKGMCCSKASVAFWARRHGDGRLSGVRVAMGAVAPTVVSVPEAQVILDNQLLTPDRIRAAAECCSRAVRAIDDIRSTAGYRRGVVGALLAQGLMEVLDHSQKLKKRRRRRRA